MEVSGKILAWFNRLYDESGKLREDGYYYSGERHQILKEYNENGELYKKTKYCKGEICYFDPEIPSEGTFYHYYSKDNCLCEVCRNLRTAKTQLNEAESYI